MRSQEVVQLFILNDSVFKTKDLNIVVFFYPFKVTCMMADSLIYLALKVISKLFQR